MKPWTILLQPDAEAEARAAYLWYAARSLRAARGFQSAFDDAIGSIGEAPRMYPVFEAETRKRLFTSYPYALIYTIGESQIAVLAVMHLHRQPGYWK